MSVSVNGIEVAVPGAEKIVLHTPPESYEKLVENIGDRVQKDPQTVRITYTNPAGQRLMINGDSRYQEALDEYTGQPLPVAVIFVPEATPGLDVRLLVRLQAGEEVTKTRAVTLEEDPYEPAKTKVCEIVENSRHYLSPNLKKAFRGLLLPEVFDCGTVDLSDCDISCYECFLLSQLLPLLPPVRVLKLRNNHINDEGLATLAQVWVGLQHLEEIDLSYNEISPASVKVLIDTLPALSQLTSLSLSFNPLQQTDFEALFQSLPRRIRIMQHKTEKCVVQ